MNHLTQKMKVSSKFMSFCYYTMLAVGQVIFLKKYPLTLPTEGNETSEGGGGG